MSNFLSQIALKNQHLIKFLLESGRPIKIEFGSSQKRMEGWITMDLDPNSDLCMDLSQPLPFPDNCVEEIYSSHLLEHFSFPDPMVNFLSECYRILKPGGFFKIAVPNARIYIESYENPEQFDPEKYCLYTPAYHYHSKIDFINYIAYMDGHHRYLFDEENLPKVIAHGGFENVKLRDFEPGLDLESRKHESIYAEAIKPGASYPVTAIFKSEQKPKLKTPVCLMIFNRPDTTQQVFNVIRQVKPEKLLVIADGPRFNVVGEAEKCAATRAIINQVDWDCEVLTNYSDINLGCRHRVSSGLTWVFNTVEEAIILEDDCLPDVTFFRFCEELLERYRHEPNIMTISGNNFQSRQNNQQVSYYFSRYNHLWGWATWRRAWKFYDLDMKLWPEIRDSNGLEKILEHSAINVAECKEVFQAAYEGYNTWDHAWTFACWVHGGLTIFPHVNLVSNIGFREDATHTTDQSPFANLPTKPMSFPLQHPTVVMRNTQSNNLTEPILFGHILYENISHLKLKEINLLLFLDWTQEDQLYSQLSAVIKTLVNHPDKSQIKLLIDHQEMSPEEADLMLSSMMMNLLMEDELDVEHGPDITLVGQLTQPQWINLLSVAQGRIGLESENLAGLDAVDAEQMPQFPLEQLLDWRGLQLKNNHWELWKLKDKNYIAFPDWKQSEETLYLELANLFKLVASLPNKNSITVYLNSQNISDEDANLILSSIFMNLFMETEVDITEGLEILLTGRLSDVQSQALYSRLTARIILEHEDKIAISSMGGKPIPIWVIPEESVAYP